MKVLHVTVHTGGGVGTVIKNLVDNTPEVTHIVGCLNNEDPRSIRVDGSIHDLRNNTDELKHLIVESDIVLLHWYNNPLLYEFLVTLQIPPCRLIVWAHANNLYPPYVMPEKLVNMCDRFIFTSPVSMQAREYQSLSIEQKSKFGAIWSVADMTPFLNVKRPHHDTFNIGYAGTIDFNSKMHPDFVAMCKAINIPDAVFIICGDGPHVNRLKQQVKDAGLWNRFIFSGRVSDLSTWYAQMDVFGYPLYEKHYGTCEQVLGEAMAAGAVPVVLNNPSEYLIVSHNYNGIVTSTSNYPREIERLHDNPDVLKKLSNNARKRSCELYNTDAVISQWRREFESIMETDRTRKSWYADEVGSLLFSQSLGGYARILESGDINDIIAMFKSNRQWFSESKGSILQYSQVYPHDKKLKEWRGIISQIEKEVVGDHVL